MSEGQIVRVDFSNPSQFFACIPRFFLEPCFTAHERLLMLHYYYAEQLQQTVRETKEALGFSISTISRARASLEELGWITVEHNDRKEADVVKTVDRYKELVFYYSIPESSRPDMERDGPLWEQLVGRDLTFVAVLHDGTEQEFSPLIVKGKLTRFIPDVFHTETPTSVGECVSEPHLPRESKEKTGNSKKDGSVFHTETPYIDTRSNSSSSNNDHKNIEARSASPWQKNAQEEKPSQSENGSGDLRPWDRMTKGERNKQMVFALASVLCVDPTVNFGKWAKLGKKLRDAGYSAAQIEYWYSPPDKIPGIKEKYGADLKGVENPGWYYTHHWITKTNTAPPNISVIFDSVLQAQKGVMLRNNGKKEETRDKVLEDQLALLNSL